MTAVTIRHASERDVGSIVSLLDQIDRFYGDEVTEDATTRDANVTAALFGQRPSAYALLAMTEDDDVVGLASYSFLWPAAGSSTSLYLKELYVAAGQRERGVGRQLMQALFDIAKLAQCSRVEWTTDLTNTGAQKFYASLGEAPYSGKLFYRHETTS